MNRQIEEYSLNAWPALHTILHDGWLLRFAEGYTKRSNSVQAIYPGHSEHLDGKISFCEAMYSKADMDTVFKITPFVPGDLDSRLESRDYSLLDPTSVKVLNRLDLLNEPIMKRVEIEEELTDAWLDTMSHFNQISDPNKMITRQLLSSRFLTKGFCTLYRDSIPVACGLGVIEQNHVGLLDVVTHPDHRNQGFGEQLILHILHWARAKGASRSYLQVVQSNAPAVRLYDKLGYQEIYTYWYRHKMTRISS
jgi:GNAT superfamily N-acetyltransferase